MSERRMRRGDRGGPSGRAAYGRALEMRRATERAILQLSGERGFEGATVASVLERSGSTRHRFYETWPSKERCYAEAYESAVENLYTQMRATCTEAPDWASGMRRGLRDLAAFVERDPQLAAGLLVEVHTAGGPALAKRDEVIQQLAGLVDRARLDAGLGQDLPPPATAIFVVYSIEAAVIRTLAERRPLRGVLPDLLFIAVAPYFGAPVARRAVRGFPGEE